MILHNPSKKDIIDYRVEEIEFDSQGNKVIDTTTSRPKWTGNTLEWTIKAGEKVEFPDYVAEYLVSIYSFLNEIKPKDKVKPKTAEAKVGGDFKCKFCSKSFTTKKGIAIHTGLKHFDEL